jgi:serine/threonine protein kinase
MTSIADVLGGRYRLVRLLGRGGMSDVYEATDEFDGGSVAIKIVRSSDPEYVRRLTQEARALESFEHPGLIRLLDTGLAGDDAFLVMEFVDGPTLATSLRSGPLGTQSTAMLGARLADALAYVHERGIVHRDVKPSNILLSTSGEAWLGDFGVAQHHDATTLTAVGTTLGTVVYMAPEQLEDHQVGPSADIWSLGIVLLECLTGKRVYEGSPSEIVARRMSGPVPLPVDLPVPWKLLLRGMLDPRPDQRLDGAQVAALLVTSPFVTPWQPSDADVTQRLSPVTPGDLTALLPGLGAPVVSTGDDTLIAATRRGAASPRAVRPRWLVPAVLVAVVALCVGLIYSFASSPPSIPTTTKPPATTTSTTSTTTTTTTSPATGSGALSTLVGNLATGQIAGTLDNASEQKISQQADQALVDEAAGNSHQAASDLQQAATTITNGVQNSLIDESEGTTLQQDLSSLASALGVTDPSATPTTTSPRPPFGPGNGKGHGHDHG